MKNSAHFSYKFQCECKPKYLDSIIHLKQMLHEEN
jgi:hypothetical protein